MADSAAQGRIARFQRGSCASISFLLAALAALCLSGCATSYDARGVYYKVRMGDSVWRIASTHRVDVQELAEYNNILDPNDVQPGMKLYIPPREKRTSFKKLPFGQSVGSARPEKKHGRKRDDSYSKPIQTFRGRFDWPVDGRVTSLFGLRNGSRHDGIDIGAPQGTPIRAAAAGRVVFVGQMRGYGNLVLLRHPDDFFTAYSHNRANKVKKGQAIKKGEVIADVGRTGRATAPHLHFEIRHGQTARNPLFFLPEKKGAAGGGSRAAR